MAIEKTTLIIGGGIVGMTLAIKLAQAKRPVIVIDVKPLLSDAQWQAKLHQRDARVYALNQASINVLSDIGVWQVIAQSNRKVDYTQMHVWQTNGIGELYFADRLTPQFLGSMVEPTVIEQALYQRAQAEDITPYLQVLSGQQVTHMDWLGEQQGYRVFLQPVKQVGLDAEFDKTIEPNFVEGALLVGADGRNSYVRQQAGIELDVLPYQQTAICCAIRTEKPHQQTARQAMLPTGTLALLPLADTKTGTNLDIQNAQNELGESHSKPDSNPVAENNQPENNQPDIDRQHWQSVVWTLPTHMAETLIQADEQQLADELAFASGYELGLIDKIESIASFPLVAQQAKHYIANNLALIGDAAHTVHPMAGQGLNLGMLDVQCLYELLIKDAARSQQKFWGHPQTLQQYQRQRRANNGNMMHGLSLLNWLFAGSQAQALPIQQLRNMGMHQVGKNRRLMRWFAKQASGL